MDEEKLKLYYIIEHQARIMKAQEQDIATLNFGMWLMFGIFIIFAMLNMLLSFYVQIGDFLLKIKNFVWKRK
jgi:uncharacterized membrane protein